MLRSFHVLVGHLHFFFGKMFIQFHFPFFNQVVCYFEVELYDMFIYVRYYSLISHIICKYFLRFCRLSFHFINDFLCCAKTFKFN